ncbi:NADH-ubiquinone oxidoreductase-F iron-sulfur binding region domain-containing protein [Luedemannella helvata]|uniref:NADH-quinone oxidoreductase subunit NuoF family protein n=1 Tax=Luedemannella helvata TaxID=349315 RepID=A0ABN2KLV0_9ACTN
MSVPPVRNVGPARLTAGLNRLPRLDFDTHRTVHGPLPPLSLDDLLVLATDIKLTGRGGAGFPFATKLRAVAQQAARRRTECHVVVNATEGEPGSWKDRMLLSRAPHLILDGALLAAHALGARSITVGVADGEASADYLSQALGERRMAIPTRVVVQPERFISGESGALVNGVNGRSPIPPGRKVLAAESGVDSRPTLLSNAETFAQLAVAARLGPAGYTSVGTSQEPGTVLLTVGGAAAFPAVIETPTGVRLMDVLRLCGATIGPGVLVGGYHGAWISRDAVLRAEISRAGMKAVGGALGAGIVLPLGEGSCPLGEAAQVAQYLAGQSAGQCGPCRTGLPDLADALAMLANGTGGEAAMAAVRRVAAAVNGRGACAHPDGTARFVLSTLDAFPDDVAAHLHRGGCGNLVRGVLPVPRALAGRKLAVDWARCDGHGLCATVAPELIHLDGNGFPAFADSAVPEWLEGSARRAVRRCPALALRLATPAR